MLLYVLLKLTHCMNPQKDTLCLAIKLSLNSLVLSQCKAHVLIGLPKVGLCSCTPYLYYAVGRLYI